LLKYRNFYLGEVAYFEMDWKEALDIDNYEDLDLGKALYNMINEA
jgi:CMP-N-acetylneuraminic acid synthetase